MEQLESYLINDYGAYYNLWNSILSLINDIYLNDNLNWFRNKTFKVRILALILSLINDTFESQPLSNSFKISLFCELARNRKRLF